MVASNLGQSILQSPSAESIALVFIGSHPLNFLPAHEVSVNSVDKKFMELRIPRRMGGYGRSLGDAGGDSRPDGRGNRRPR